MTRASRGLPAVVAGLGLAGALLVSGPAAVQLDIGAADQALPLRTSGFHGSEQHGGQHIRWTNGQARVSWPAVLGFQPRAAEILLDGFPGRAGDEVAVTINGAVVSRHVVTGHWQTVEVALPRTGGVMLEIRSLTHRTDIDPRELGVRISTVTLRGSTISSAVAGASLWHLLVLVATGGGIWLAAWSWRAASLTTATLAGPATVATASLLATGALLWWQRPALLHEGAVHGLAAAIALTAVVRLILRQSGVRCGWASASAIGVALPFLAVALLAQHYFVDVPRWDIWDMVPLIEQQRNGTLGVGDIWRAHNTHRPVTGRLLLLGNAMLTRWNHWVDLGMVLAAAWLQVVVLAVFVARTQRRAQCVHPAVLPVAALFVFSLVQWENWLQGWQVVLLLGVLGVSAALLVLCEGQQCWRNLFLAAGLGLVATFSFGSCLLVWPLGVLALAARRAEQWRSRAAMWVGMGLVTSAVYLYGLPSDPSGPNREFLLSLFGVRQLVGGLFVSVATPLLYRPTSFVGPFGLVEYGVILVGALGVCTAAVVLLNRWRTDASREATWLFPALLCLFGLGAGLLAAAGRVWLTMQAMTASRYVVFGACVWLGLLMLLGTAVPAQRRGTRVAAIALVVLLALVCAAASASAVPWMRQHYESSAAARDALLRDDLHSAATVLFPNALLLDQRRDVLRRAGMSLYRRGAVRPRRRGQRRPRRET